MKQILVSLFTISIFLGSVLETNAQVETDTIPYKEKYGVRVGIDLSKPLRTFLEDDYQGFEVMGDYRLYKDYYLAGEIGNEKMAFSEENLSVTARGSYIKLGADYNAYQNWEGMENMIYVGLRYGFATFSQTLEEYSIYTRTQFFPPEVVEGPFDSNGLTASWLEFVTGIKVEIFNNLYLGLNVQLKRQVTQSTPDNFDNLIIPGFNRTYDGSSFGVGYGYNISYLIPLYKKAKN